MKKKGVNITINFSNKTLYALIGIFAILIVSGVVYAYGSSNPSVMGHNLAEIQMPSCSEGQVLKYTSGAWTCGTDNAQACLPTGAGTHLPSACCSGTATGTLGPGYPSQPCREKPYWSGRYDSYMASGVYVSCVCD